MEASARRVKGPKIQETIDLLPTVRGRKNRTTDNSMTNIIATIVITISTNLTPQVTPPTNEVLWMTNTGSWLGLTNYNIWYSNDVNYRVLIKKWAAEGKVCEVLGHHWRDGCDLGIGCCVLGCYENSRYCPVCKSVQRRSNPKWE